MNFKLLVLIALALSTATTAHAITETAPDPATVISAYRLYKEVPVPALRVPTVVEVPFTEGLFERSEVGVFNMSKGAFEPAYVKATSLSATTKLSLQAAPSRGSEGNMLDGNVNTYVDFALPNSAQGSAQIIVSSATPLTTASLTTLLDANVALPTTIEIRARVNGADTIVVAKRVVDAITIRFPKTTSSAWTITYTYAQPLRISELRFTDEASPVAAKHAVRFLAQPNQAYRIYFDPDRLARPSVGESANLSSARDVLVLPAGTTKDNFEYRIADIDADGVPDIRDNCVSLTNADQADVNTNGRGDVCDDFDQDSVINAVDNCPDQPNVNQADTDSDEIGDVCDAGESRLTEKYAWLPWAGLGFAVFILIALFALMVHKPVITEPATGSETL